MKMPKLLRILFTRADPAMDAMADTVKVSSAQTVAASNRLHATIADFLVRNDHVTGRTDAKDNLR